MSLYEISQKYSMFLDLVEKSEIDGDGVPPEALKDTLDSIDSEFEEKADAMACVIKNLNAEIAAIAKERKELRTR